VNVDAVFEAAPYRPGADGRFQPYKEASGLAAHGAATLAETRRRAAAAMAGLPRPWWVAGGWALDLFLGRRTRPHADLEISVLAADQRALFEQLRRKQGDARRWVFRRDRAVTRPLHELGAATADGVPFVVPEVALLFKAKRPRFKDQRDFDRVLPHLDGPARAWLASA